MGSATTSGIEGNEAQRANKFAGMDDAAKQAARDAGCLISVARRTGAAHAPTMFAVDETTATAIRDVFNERGELSAIAEFRRHFPLIGDNDHARQCVQIIAKPLPAGVRRPQRRKGV